VIALSNHDYYVNMRARCADGLCGPHAHHRCYRYLPLTDRRTHMLIHTHTQRRPHIQTYMDMHTYTHTRTCKLISYMSITSFNSQPRALPCPLSSVFCLIIILMLFLLHIRFDFLTLTLTLTLTFFLFLCHPPTCSVCEESILSALR
jgi:hypothetical protein